MKQLITTADNSLSLASLVLRTEHVGALGEVVGKAVSISNFFVKDQVAKKTLHNTIHTVFTGQQDDELAKTRKVRWDKEELEVLTTSLDPYR